MSVPNVTETHRPTRDVDFPGFGDVVTPEPVQIGYPTLLEYPASSLLAYPLKNEEALQKPVR